MQTLELFSGKKSFSNQAALLGLKTFTVDFNPKFKPDLCIDINNLNIDLLPNNIKIVWASIDCTAFSIASSNKYFETVPYKYRKYELIPKCEKAENAIRTVNKTIDLIFEINPDFYYIENPRGLLNHCASMRKIPFKSSVYYADYGFNYMKPTDIWHNNLAWTARKPKHKYSYSHLRHMMSQVSKTNRSIVPASLINEILTQTLNNYANIKI